jgi:hypothetical protein
MNALLNVPVHAIPSRCPDRRTFPKTIVLVCNFLLGATCCVKSYDPDLSAIS